MAMTITGLATLSLLQLMSIYGYDKGKGFLTLFLTLRHYGWAGLWQ